MSNFKKQVLTFVALLELLLERLVPHRTDCMDPSHYSLHDQLQDPPLRFTRSSDRYQHMFESVGAVESYVTDLIPEAL